MQLFDSIWFRIRSLFRSSAMNREFEEELRFHIERETAENIRRGMNPDEARRKAMAEFVKCYEALK